MDELFREIDIPLAPVLVRDEKGRITNGIAQDTDKNGTAGSPCKFCKNQEKYLKIIKDYIEDCGHGGDRRKPKYPSIAELAILMGVYRQRISEWEDKRTEEGELEHPEFSDLIKMVKTHQFFYLERRVQGRYNPTGAIFLMKTQQGQIETEKKILAGSQNEPVDIRIIEDRQIGLDK